MTPEQIKAACDAAGMPLREIAERIGISHGHLRNARAGTQRLSRPVEILLTQLAEKGRDA